MNIKPLAILVLAIPASWAVIPSLADDNPGDKPTPTAPTGLGQWYYKAGGNDPYLTFSSTDRTNIEIGAGAAWTIGNACNIDPNASFTDEFSNVKNSIYNAGNELLSSAQALVQSQLLSEIRDLNPGWYDTITKGMLEARQNVNLAIKSCEDMQRDLATGKSPIDGWVKIANREDWIRSTATGQNPVETKATINEQSGNDGITWVDGGKAGGLNQPPIEVIGDTTAVGYQQWTGSTSDRIYTVWPTPEKAKEWVTAVVGEKEVQLCNGCNKLKTRIGQGLRVKHVEERQAVFQALDTVLSSAYPPTDEQLDSLSVPGMGIAINREVINALSKEEPAEREILANRLISEIALGRVMEKSLIARELLLSGRQEPNISANGEAQADVSEALARLDQQIQNILFEQEVRAKVLTGTAQLVLQRASTLNSQPVKPQPSRSPVLPMCWKASLKRKNR